MSNNKNTKLQFTKLNQTDMKIHSDDYIELLVGDKTDIPSNRFGMYCSYALNELTNAARIFRKTFA